MAVKKVAITTWWHYHNYGTALQATATYNVLKNLGYNPDIVNYIPSGKKYSTNPDADREHEENWENYPRVVDERRDGKFDNFLQQHLTFTPKAQDDGEFAELSDRYDVFITGSDQIWAPRVFDERYFLDFVQDNRKKIAYAPSIGLPTIENEYVRGRMRELISQFAHVSVREEQGAETIKSELGLDAVEVMPDPTLLLDYNEWRKIIPKPKTTQKEKYILCYFWGENESAWKHATKIAKQTKLPIKIVPVLQKDEKYGEFIESVGPEEFFNLIDDAEMVLTDSFHGAIFSIITRTPFYVFERFKQESGGSQNSRVYNLLKISGLESRLVRYDDKLREKYDSKTDFSGARKAIKEQKERATGWLESALIKVRKIDAVKFEARITYYSHSIEKSLSNPSFEQGHAFSVAKEVVDLLRQYSDLGFDKNSPAYLSALSALKELYLRHKGSKYQDEIKKVMGAFFEEVVDTTQKTGGSLVIHASEKKNNSSKNFKELSANRYSVRNYLDKQVDEKDIREVVEIAQKSPSACNRQQARVYYMTDKEVIDRILGIQGTLNDYPTPPLLFLITATDDAYLFDTEKNNGYIDGSLFAMSLLYALEYKGIGACPLHTMFTEDTCREVMNLLNIPENEKLIMFISAGYFEKEILACKSYRYPVDYILHRVTRLTSSGVPSQIVDIPMTFEQIEIEKIRAENAHLEAELSSFLSTKRSARLLAGNIRRHYSRGPLGNIKRALRLRTRAKSLSCIIIDLANKLYWFPKNAVIDYRVKRITKTQLNRGDRIPKIIHYIWVGGAKKPESVEKYIESWKKYCPDYRIIEWNEKNYNIKSNRYAREAYREKKWAFVTDFIRLDVLDRFGGIYMDSDVEVLQSLDGFLNEPAFSSFEAGDPSQIFLPTGMMASEKGGKWVRYLKSYYSSSRSFFRKDGQIDDTPNTVTITDMTVDKYGICLNNKLQKFDDFTMYPSEYFCPKSWSTRKINLTKNTHTIHHFAASWLPPEIRKLQHEGEE